MCKDLDACRSGKDFIGYAKKHGGEIRNGHGSHQIVKGPKGAAVVPFHNKDLGKGLRVKLVKSFIAIGLVLSLVLAII